MDNEERIELEYVVHAPVKEIYQRISTPEGLGLWFADKAYRKDKLFTFVWNEREHYATLLRAKKNKSCKFMWNHKPDHFHFEIAILASDYTDDVALLITDYTTKEEKESAIEIWDILADRLSDSFL